MHILQRFSQCHLALGHLSHHFCFSEVREPKADRAFVPRAYYCSWVQEMREKKHTAWVPSWRQDLGLQPCALAGLLVWVSIQEGDSGPSSGSALVCYRQCVLRVPGSASIHCISIHSLEFIQWCTQQLLHMFWYGLLKDSTIIQRFCLVVQVPMCGVWCPGEKAMPCRELTAPPTLNKHLE